MQHIYPLLEKADVLVLGTPVYWFNVSGLMKNFIDRLTCAENSGFRYEGKIAALAASKEEDGAIAALMNMAAPLNQIGFLLMPYAVWRDQTDANKDWLSETTAFVGRKLVEVSTALKKVKWEH